MSLVFIDSSIWIEYFRGSNIQIRNEVHRLLDLNRVALPIPVRIEILSGASKKDFKTLHSVFSAIPVYYPSKDSWKQMEEWIQVAKNKGISFGFADLLIASIVSDNKGTIWSQDKDFIEMEKIHFVKKFHI